MIYFGPSGNDDEFYSLGFKHTTESAPWLKEKGLNAFEYAFNRGVNISDEKAIELGKVFADNGIRVSAHAPYYINLANPDDEMVEKSYGYIISGLKKLKLMGGNHLVVHVGSQGKLTRDEAISLIYKRLEKLKELLVKENLCDMYVCLETMGKPAQIGTYEEIIDMCTMCDNFMPTFDFGHINALTGGKLKTSEDYEKIIKLCYNKLGEKRTNDVHVHFSKIEFGAKGEIRHLTFEDEKYGPEFGPLARVFKKYKMSPMVICESRGTQSKDAKIMKEIYENC